MEAPPFEPAPGHGYEIKQFLGGGQHKLAFRASNRNEPRDVALIYFRREGAKVMAPEVANQLMVTGNSENAQYVAQLMGLLQGKDGKFYLVEELLAQPLDVLAPIDDLVRFTRIARDLCKGLAHLHGSGLIHRDLKLDNCGIDHQGRAKIFDLGTVVSEPGSVEGSILGREPSLFLNSGSQAASRAADVWALGATLFALRTGDYPFVSAEEVGERRRINDDLRQGDKTGAFREAKTASDQRIRDRALAERAEEMLFGRVSQTLRGKAESILREMLIFDSTARRPIDHFLKEWSGVAERLAAGGIAADHPNDFLEQARKFLELADRREVSITQKQLDCLAQSVTDLPEEHSKSALRARVEELIIGIKDANLVIDMKMVRADSAAVASG